MDEDGDREGDELPGTPCQVPTVAASVTGTGHVSVVETQSTVMIPLLQMGKLGSQVFRNLPEAMPPHSLGSHTDRGHRDRVGWALDSRGASMWGCPAGRLVGLP